MSAHTYFLDGPVNLTQLLEVGRLWLGCTFLLWLTGRLIVRLLCLHIPRDVLTALAIEVGLGLSFWPTLLLITDALGFHWRPELARFVVLFVGIAGFLDLIWAPRSIWQLRYKALRHAAPWLSLFGLIFLLTFLTRWRHIRDLALPPWIDSVHHTMVARLLVEQGALPETYAPFIPDGRFFYHWGYHALIAWLAWLLGQTKPLEVAQLLLPFGQILNTLSVLMLYAAGRVMFNSRRAGLLASLITGLVSWFPAYYVTWGRYTQLTGLLVLVPFLIILWKIKIHPHMSTVVAAMLLGTGTFLIHVRVFIFAMMFLTALTIFLIGQRDWRTLALWLWVGLIIAIITIPWLRVLLEYQGSRNSLLVSNSPSQIEEFNEYYNIVQQDLLWAPHNRELLSLATAGVTGVLGWGDAPIGERLLSTLWLGALIYLFIRRDNLFLGRVGRVLGLLGLWCLLIVLLLNIHLLGLPNIGIIHNNSAIITLFIPLSLSLGGLLAWIQRKLCPTRWAWQAMFLLVIVVGLWGASTMKDIVNPTTILARSADLTAMRWIKENTPSDARFAVNIWPWLGQTYAGSDGGYWIPLLTDRSSMLFPALYTSCLPKADVARVTEILTAWYYMNEMDDQMLRGWLQENRITHVYIGANGGIASPQRFFDFPFAQAIYQKDEVFIFEIE